MEKIWTPFDRWRNCNVEINFLGQGHKVCLNLTLLPFCQILSPRIVFYVKCILWCCGWLAGWHLTAHQGSPPYTLWWKISNIQIWWKKCTVNTLTLTTWILQLTFCYICFIIYPSFIPLGSSCPWELHENTIYAVLPSLPSTPIYGKFVQKLLTTGCICI